MGHKAQTRILSLRYDCIYWKSYQYEEFIPFSQDSILRSDVCDESRRIKHFKSNNLQFIKSFGYELNNLIR